MATNAPPGAATTVAADPVADPAGLPESPQAESPQAEPPLPDSAQLAGLGNVTADYRHYAKQVEPAEGIALPGGFLKWYDVHAPDAPIRPETQDQARDFLRGEAAADRLRLHDELGFVILHRCGDDT